MSDPKPEGDDQNGNGKPNDPTNQKGTESLKGKVDKQGIPLDAEERADHYKKLSEKTSSDYKEYQTNSSRGVQNLSDKNKILENENQRLKGDPQSHEEDKISREEFSKLEKRQEETEKQQRLEANKRAFNSQCKELFEQEEFKNIKSLRTEFEEYAYEEDNLGSTIEVLARSFQVVNGLIKSKPPKEGEDDEGRSGIEVGTGGGDHKPSEKGYTSEQAETMRTEDPKKYNKLAKTGKLKIVD